MTKKKVLKRRFEHAMLHYGISLVLVALAAAVLCVLCVMRIDDKTPVSLVCTPDGAVRAYLPTPAAPDTARTLRLDFAGRGSLTWRVVAASHEPEHLVLTLQPADSARFAALRGGNTLLQATRPGRRVRLIELVFRKGSNLPARGDE